MLTIKNKQMFKSEPRKELTIIFFPLIKNFLSRKYRTFTGLIFISADVSNVLRISAWVYPSSSRVSNRGPGPLTQLIKGLDHIETDENWKILDQAVVIDNDTTTRA